MKPLKSTTEIKLRALHSLLLVVITIFGLSFAQDSLIVLYSLVFNLNLMRWQPIEAIQVYPAHCHCIPIICCQTDPIEKVDYVPAPLQNRETKLSLAGAI